MCSSDLDLHSSFDMRAIIPVIRYLKHNNVDVVITHGNYRLMARIGAIFSRVPAIIHVEHTISDNKKYYHILINKILSLFTDRIICVSQNARDSLLKVEGTKKEKVVVIHNGLNPERLNNINNKKSNNAKKRVGMVGNFHEVKGHTYFIDAIAKITQSYKNVEFIFVGDGSLREIVEQRVRKYKLDRYCQFLGKRSDVGSLLQSFDVFVLSSLWEGLPVSLLEAQSLGIASVVTGVGGIPEVIKDGYNGILVPPKNPDYMASAILRILKDKNLRSAIGSNAIKVFNNKFTVENMTNKYLKQIHNILSMKAIDN